MLRRRCALLVGTTGLLVPASLRAKPLPRNNALPFTYGPLSGNGGFGPVNSGGDVPTLDLQLMNAPLDPRVTFTRASTATYFDGIGTMQTAAVNAPRFDTDPMTLTPRGLLIEEARTNLLLNSATLSTQSVTTTATATTLSFYGTGSITLSGTSAGTVNGAGAFPARAVSTFTPTAGTLTLTVSGSVTNAQLEAGAFPTSYIPTTGATATRSADSATMPTGAWFNAATGTIATEFVVRYLSTNDNALFDLPGSATLRQRVFGGGGWPLRNSVGAVGFNTANAVAAGAVSKGALAWGGTAATAALNGATPATAAVSTDATGATTLSLGSAAGTPPVNGWLRRVRYWPRALSNTELQQATT